MMSIITPKTDFIDLLQRIIEFLDNYVDVNDGDYGQPVANKAMVLQQDVVYALHELSEL